MQTLNNDRILSPKEWALTIFISSLPLIGFIMVLVWGLSNDTNIHKKNWALGTIIIYMVILILSLAFLFLFGGIALISNLF